MWEKNLKPAKKLPSAKLGWQCTSRISELCYSVAWSCRTSLSDTPNCCSPDPWTPPEFPWGNPAYRNRWWIFRCSSRSARWSFVGTRPTLPWLNGSGKHSNNYNPDAKKTAFTQWGFSLSILMWLWMMVRKSVWITSVMSLNVGPIFFRKSSSRISLRILMHNST